MAISKCSPCSTAKRLKTYEKYKVVSLHLPNRNVKPSEDIRRTWLNENKIVGGSNS